MVYIYVDHKYPSRCLFLLIKLKKDPRKRGIDIKLSKDFSLIKVSLEAVFGPFLPCNRSEVVLGRSV